MTKRKPRPDPRELTPVERLSLVTAKSAGGCNVDAWAWRRLQKLAKASPAGFLMFAVKDIQEEIANANA